MSHLQCPNGVQNFDTLTNFLEMIGTLAGMEGVVKHYREGEEDREYGPVDPFTTGTLSSYKAPCPMNKL